MFDSLVRNKAYKTHIALVTNQSNYCNMVLWSASLHQLSKTTEIVTGWESSIAVLTKIIGQPIFWPKNIKFWLQNLQILTSVWLINFLVSLRWIARYASHNNLNTMKICFLHTMQTRIARDWSELCGKVFKFPSTEEQHKVVTLLAHKLHWMMGFKTLRSSHFIKVKLHAAVLPLLRTSRMHRSSKQQIKRFNYASIVRGKKLPNFAGNLQIFT